MAAEATPATPRIRDVRIQPGSESFNPVDLKTEFDNKDGMREFDIKRMEENAVELEKELIMKELETLDFLEALGSTKKVLQDLKLALQQQAKEIIDERCHRNPLASPDLTKLGKTMDDLAMIQSYGESLNMKTEASLAEELNSLRLKPAGTDQGDRFKTENEQCDQIKMVVDETSDMIQSKNCLRTSEMRLVAARKMEEAARAAEALAIAEMTVLSSGINQNGPRSTSTLQALMNEDFSTDMSRIKILRKLEEANEEVKQSKQALELASQWVEIASGKQLEAEDALHQWNIKSWKDQKAIKAKRSLNHVNQQHKLSNDLSRQMLKRNAPARNVLNRKHVHTINEKQPVAPRRKFRFVHINHPETE